jgi:hypothetical protein
MVHKRQYIGILGAKFLGHAPTKPPKVKIKRAELFFEILLLDTMFDLPSLEGVERVVISKQSLRTPPTLHLR